MIRHRECEVCTDTPTQSVLSSQCLADLQGKDLLGVLMNQPMVDLCATFYHTDDLKGSMAHQVVRMWAVHYKQFGTFQTTISKSDRCFTSLI